MYPEEKISKEVQNIESMFLSNAFQMQHKVLHCCVIKKNEIKSTLNVQTCFSFNKVRHDEWNFLIPKKNNTNQGQSKSLFRFISN